MKRSPTIAVALLALLLSACAKDPQSRWAQARATLTQAEKQVLIQHQLGTIKDDDLIALDEIVQAVRAALKRAEAQLPAGGQDFDWYMGVAMDVLAKLEKSNAPVR